MKLLFALLMLAPIIVLAQLPPNSGVGFLDSIMHYLANIEASVIAGVLALVEILLRLVPTKVPMSLFALIKRVLDVGIYILKYGSEFLGKIVVMANRLK